MSGHFIINLPNEFSANFEVSYEMTMNVRFCLSYDFPKWDFVACIVVINCHKHWLNMMSWTLVNQS